MTLVWIVTLVLPPDIGKLGGAAAFAMALTVALLVSAGCFTAGLAIGILSVRARRQDHRRVAWFDYALLAAAAVPLLAVAVAVAHP